MEQISSYHKLDPWAADYLRKRAVPPDIANERGYRMVLQGKRDGGLDFAAAHGYPADKAGLLIPLHGLLNPDATQLRVDPALVTEDSTGKTRKFWTPSKQKNVLATHPRTRDRLKQAGELIYIPEGVTRVDALASFDIPAVGMTGIWSWRSLKTLPDFDEIVIKGNKLVIGPDGDVRTNVSVFKAVQRLVTNLEDRGALSVAVVALPDGMGLDDWIAANSFDSAAALIHALREWEIPITQVKKPINPPPPGSIYARMAGKSAGLDVITAARDALADAYGDPTEPDALYLRDSNLVEVQEIPDPGDSGRTHRIEPVSSATLRERMMGSAYWYDYGGAGKEHQPCWPEMGLVNVIADAPTQLQLPTLLGIRPFPVLVRKKPRGEFSLLNVEGFAEHWYLTRKPLPVLPDVKSAVRLLLGRGEGLISDFPFADDNGEGDIVNGASVANALAHPLSLIAKPAVGLTPLFMFDKPQWGTGATLLLETLSALATGEDLSTHPPPGYDSEEWVKTLVGFLQGSYYQLAIDNARYLTADALAQFLTASRFQARILGGNKILDVPVDFVVAVTGNNPTTSPDIQSRTIPIRLDRRNDVPEEYRPPDGWAVPNPVEAARQEKFRAALFTLPHNWLQLGCPLVEAKRRYPLWESVVGGILEAAGIEGFLENVEHFREQSSTGADSFQPHVGWWWEEYRDKWVPSPYLAKPFIAADGRAAEMEPWFKTEAPSLGGMARALSSHLKQKRDYTARIESEGKSFQVRLEVNPKGEGRRYTYRLVPVGGDIPPPSAPRLVPDVDDRDEALWDMEGTTR